MSHCLISTLCRTTGEQRYVRGAERIAAAGYARFIVGRRSDYQPPPAFDATCFKNLSLLENVTGAHRWRDRATGVLCARRRRNEPIDTAATV